jgi:hypothetical protein
MRQTSKCANNVGDFGYSRQGAQLVELTGIYIRLVSAGKSYEARLCEVRQQHH